MLCSQLSKQLSLHLSYTFHALTLGFPVFILFPCSRAWCLFLGWVWKAVLLVVLMVLGNVLKPPESGSFRLRSEVSHLVLQESVLPQPSCFGINTLPLFRNVVSLCSQCLCPAEKHVSLLCSFCHLQGFSLLIWEVRLMAAT